MIYFLFYLRNIKQKQAKMNKTQNKNNVIINNISLEYNKYDISTLEENVKKFSLWKLLKTQTLTPDFCVKYILNEDYASCDEDTYICWQNVLQCQSHITKDELMGAIKKGQEQEQEQELEQELELEKDQKRVHDQNKVNEM